MMLYLNAYLLWIVKFTYGKNFHFEAIFVLLLQNVS